MSLTIITIYDIDYVAYATLEEADARLAVDPVRGPAWRNLDAIARKIAIVAGTNRLDLLIWKGSKTGGAEQRNAWPRTGVTYPDGTPVPPDALPYEIEVACILLAGSIASDPTIADIGSTASNIKKLQAGRASIEYFRNEQGVPLQDETVFDIIQWFLSGAGEQAFHGKTLGRDRDPALKDGQFELSRGL